MGAAAREVAFITGAASGIGRAVAQRLARRHAALGLFDLDDAGLRAVAEDIRSAGRSAVFIVGDVSDSESVQTAVAATVEQFGGLDTAVACAGIAVMGTALETSLADWQRILAVNLTGTFLTARHTIPYLVDRGGGSFIAVSSVAGVVGSQGWAAYTATKHAVVGLVRCLALDHAPDGVRSNCICPTLVETPMAERIMRHMSAEDVEFSKRVIPLGRFARPQEVAEVVAHLSSREASFTNGLVYLVDGGETTGLYRAVAELS